MSQLPQVVRRGSSPLRGFVSLLSLGLCVATAAGNAFGVVDLRHLFSFSSYGKPILFRPQGIAISSSRHEIYVADTGKGEIVILNTKGVPLYRFEHQVPDRNNGTLIRGEPVGILAGPRGTMIVTDRLSDEIDVLDFRGRVLRSVSVSELLPEAGRAAPGRMAGDLAGNLYVIESNSGQVVVLDPQWRLVRRFGGRGQGEGRFKMLADIAVDASGMTYVLDSQGTPVVQVFDQQGRFKTGFGRHTNKPDGFHFPIALTLDSAKRLWIADAFSHEVKAFTSSGEFIGAFGQMGTANGEFYFPSDIATGPSDVLYVLEKGGRRVQSFQIQLAGMGQSVPTAQ